MFVQISLILLVLFAYIIRKRQMTIFERLGIPGPKPNLIFGNAIDIAKHGTRNVFPKWTKKYGPFVGFYVGGHPQLLVSDFEFIRLALVKDFHRFSERNDIIPGGIFPQTLLRKNFARKRGTAWKQLRSKLTPMFSSSKLNQMEDLIMSSIKNMMKQIDMESKTGIEINFMPHAQELTFSTSTKCITGVNLSIRECTYEAESLMKSVRPQIEKSSLAIVMLLFPLLTCIAYPLRFFWETIRLKMLWSPEGIYLNFVRKIVRARKNADMKFNDILQSLLDFVPSTNPSGVAADSPTSTPILSRANKQLSEDSVISNLFVLLIAGYETTSSTLQFVISDLINHQHVQDELRAKLQEQIGLDGGTVNIQSISKVPLLLYAIRESLRMHPPLTPFLNRVAEEPYEYNGIKIPKGMGIYIDVFSVHNDSQLWDEPQMYKPERFAKDYNKLAFLSFGAGQRICIGMQFAYMQLQLAVANLILRYKFEPGPSTEKELQVIETTATMAPKNGVYCKLVKIKQ